MLEHAKYMKMLTTILISSFHLIEVLSTIYVRMVLCTNEEISKLLIQHDIKETTFDKIDFLHHL